MFYKERDVFFFIFLIFNCSFAAMQNKELIKNLSLENFLRLQEEKPDLEEIGSYFDLMVISEVVDFINEFPEFGYLIINSMKTHRATAVFKLLDIGNQKLIINKLEPHKTAELLNELNPDDRIAFLEELPHLVLTELIKLLNPEERKITLAMLGYPEDSVGRLMTPEYISVEQNTTIKEVFEVIRHKSKQFETSEIIYVIDQDGRLIDDIKIKDLIIADPEKKIIEISDYRYESLNANLDQEKAKQIFKNSNRFALPVVDDNQILLGIVTIDDILWVAEEEYSEDLQKMAASETFNEDYLSISIFKLIRKRVGWLIILFLGELITASVMSSVEDDLSRAIVLSLFIPLILSSGGNSGSQASTLIIQGLTIGSIEAKDWVKVISREFFVGITLGFVLGLIGFIRVWGWYYISPEIIGSHPQAVSMVVLFSVMFIVMIGAITGSMLPLVMKRLGADPAVSSTPFVATIMDVSGILIYFTIARQLLDGIL